MIKDAPKMPLNQNINLNEALKFSENLAIKVGALIEKGKTKIEVVKFKDRQDIATNIDLEAEKLIISAINTQFPHHHIISEEAGDNHQHSDYTWIIDPLDGTKEYLRNIPQYNTSFALLYHGKPILSVVYHPVGNILYSAAKSLGAFENGHPIQVSQTTKIEDAFLYSYLPSHKIDYQAAKLAYQQIFNLSRVSYRIRGSAEEAITLCYLASGKIDGALNFVQSNQPHDIIPGLFIALEAGATITNPQGKSPTNDDYCQGFVASNGLIHTQIISAINQSIK